MTRIMSYSIHNNYQTEYLNLYPTPLSGTIKNKIRYLAIIKPLYNSESRFHWAFYCINRDHGISSLWISLLIIISAGIRDVTIWTLPTELDKEDFMRLVLGIVSELYKLRSMEWNVCMSDIYDVNVIRSLCLLMNALILINVFLYRNHWCMLISFSYLINGFIIM